MPFRENFDGSVQVVARPNSVECLEDLVSYLDWPTFRHQLTFESLFNQGLRGAARPSTTLQFIVAAGDDFDHPTDGITTSTGARVQVVLPCVLE